MNVCYFQTLASACACCPYGKRHWISCKLAFIAAAAVDAEKPFWLTQAHGSHCANTHFFPASLPPILPSTILHFLESFPQGVFSSLTTLNILKKNNYKKANCCNTEYSLCFQGCWWKPLTCNKTLVLMPRIVNCDPASVGCCRLHKTSCLSNMTFMHREAVPERCWLNLQKSLGHTLQGVAWGFCSGEFDSITHKKKKIHGQRTWILSNNSGLYFWSGHRVVSFFFFS